MTLFTYHRRKKYGIVYVTKLSETTIIGSFRTGRTLFMKKAKNIIWGVNIIGKHSDYTIDVNKGAGEYTIDGEKVHDNAKIGDGTNSLQLDGGIGKVKVEF